MMPAAKKKLSGMMNFVADEDGVHHKTSTTAQVQPPKGFVLQPAAELVGSHEDGPTVTDHQAPLITRGNREQTQAIVSDMEVNHDTMEPEAVPRDGMDNRNYADKHTFWEDSTVGSMFEEPWTRIRQPISRDELHAPRDQNEDMLIPIRQKVYSGNGHAGGTTGIRLGVNDIDELDIQHNRHPRRTVDEKSGRVLIFPWETPADQDASHGNNIRDGFGDIVQEEDIDDETPTRHGSSRRTTNTAVQGVPATSIPPPRFHSAHQGDKEVKRLFRVGQATGTPHHPAEWKERTPFTRSYPESPVESYDDILDHNRRGTLPHSRLRTRKSSVESLGSSLLAERTDEDAVKKATRSLTEADDIGASEEELDIIMDGERRAPRPIRQTRFSGVSPNYDSSEQHVMVTTPKHQVRTRVPRGKKLAEADIASQQQSRDAKKRRLSLDYDDSDLHAMNFSTLREQPFDYDPRAGTSRVTPLQTATPASESTVKDLERYKGKSAVDQQQFFAQMSMQDWEESGDWFFEQFGNLLQKTKEARTSKREMLNKFEAEVEARESAVQGQIENILTTFQELKKNGQSMMMGKNIGS
jgi:hypothetical protein